MTLEQMKCYYPQYFGLHHFIYIIKILAGIQTYIHTETLETKNSVLE